MPVGGEVLISGQYLVTYSGLAVGIFKGEAGLPTVMQQNFGKPVKPTDAYGDSTLDVIHGGADHFFIGTFEEWKSAVFSALYPFGTMGQMGVIGRRYYDMASALTLTAVTGTPAQVAVAPATFSAPKAILAPGHQAQWQFGPVLREVQLKLQLLPATVPATPNPVTGWYSQT
jgi:hypothetical protein